MHIRTRRLCLTGLLAFVLLQPAPAQAHAPPFFWMPDLSIDSQAGAEVLLGRIDVPVDDAARLAELNLRLDFALTDSIAIVGRLPLAYVSYAEDASSWALGNAGLGLQLGRTNRIARERYLRFGAGVLLQLPTASDEDDAGIAAGIASTFNVPDAGRFLVNTTTVRVRGDLRYEHGNLFAQTGVGLSRHMPRGEDEAYTDLLAGLGAGVTVSPYLALLAELTLVWDVLHEDDDTILPTLDVGVRFHNPDLMLGARLYWPFGQEYRDLDAIGLGVDMALRF